MVGNQSNEGAERERLSAIERFRLREIGRVAPFDDLAALAAEALGAPMGLVSIVDEGEQCFTGLMGLNVARGLREDAFCALTILGDEPFVIPDTLADARFRTNPYVTGEPLVRFYAGAPVRVDGQSVGTLCALDRRPRAPSPAAMARLMRPARVCGALFESHRGALASAESEARLRSLVEAMPLALSVYDSGDRLVRTNARYRQAFLGDEAAVLLPGLSFPEVLDQLEARGVSIAIDGITADWKRRRVDLRRRAAGPYEMRLSTGAWLACHEIRTDAGDLIAAFTDISDVKDREAALAEQSALLRMTLESIDQGIAVFDRDARLIACSDAYFELLRMPEALRVLGTPLRAIVRDLAARSYLGEGPREEIEERVIASVKAHRGRRSEIRTPEGRVLAISRFVTDDGRTIVTVLDVTERREIDRLKDEFVSTVSHELRTPLTSITGSLGLLAGGAAGELPAGARRLVDIAHKNVQRLTHLVNDLLDIDKIGAGQIEFRREPVDLNGIVAQVVEHNIPYADRFGVRLEARPAPGPLAVLGDPDRLLQVATNLVSNAVKHSPAGETVTVEATCAGGSARLLVVDRGAGIPDQFRARIFSRFAQADASDRRAREGTGLGLAISRAIVERHGGTIGFETGHGTGTAFHVDLPVAATGTAAAAAAGRVLLCEDDAAFGALIGRLLRQGGLAVDLVGTCAEGIGRIAKASYDLAVVDLRLPDGSGFDLIRAIRARADRRDMPVLVVSALADEARLSVEAGALDVLDWLQKPVDGARLVRAVAAARGGAAPGRLRVLHVEDEPDLREVVALSLKGFADVNVAGGIAEARGLLASRGYDAVILDLDLPDGSGAALLPELAVRPGAPIPVVIFSAAEAGDDLAQRVSRALVKSRTSVDELAQVVRQLVAGPGGAP